MVLRCHNTAGTLKRSAAASTPVILVLVQGRQRVLNGAAEHADAIVNAMLPGPWVRYILIALLILYINADANEVLSMRACLKRL